MVAVELQHDGAAPGKTRDVCWPQGERVDNRREAVCGIGHAEARRQIV
jgi:hypothetical protein